MNARVAKPPANTHIATAVAVIAILLTGCSPDNRSAEINPIQSSMSAVSDQGFSKVVPNEVFQFPQDHLAHNDYKIEWWYLTANLTTESGEQIGAQWTQFRIGLAPTSISASSTSKQSVKQSDNDWATNQLYMAHAAITSNNEHLFAEKWSRGHPKLAGIKSLPFSAYLHNWQWNSQTDDLFPATLTVSDKQFSYQLNLHSEQPIQLQGEQGYSSKSADNTVASYYYSQPFIDVTGQITRNGQIDNVTGKAWLDREWSSQFLTKAQQGWDWFSIRLADESTLMIFRLRGDKNHFYSARRMFKDGSGRNINSQTHPNDIQMNTTQWQQTALGKHPIAWHIQIKSEAIDITTETINPNSDMLVTMAYWEGPIRITGSHQGEGYMELTGYK